MADANNTNIPENSLQILVDCLKGNMVADQLWPSISMVPSMLRDVKPASFNPQVVSIGPLHHDDENLQAGERLKKTYVSDLFVHLNCNIEQTLEECLSMVNESIDKIKECYVGMKPCTDTKLARIMVMDGCFILSYLFRPRIISDLLSWNTIAMDLRLVENQIPFIVLNNIFKCTILKQEPSVSLINDIIFRVCKNASLFKRDVTNRNISEHSTDHDHILGILHKYYKPASPIPSTRPSPSIRTVLESPTAVSFKPNEDKPTSPIPSTRSSPSISTVLESPDAVSYVGCAAVSFEPNEDKPASPIPSTRSSPSICTLEMAGVSFKPNEDKPASPIPSTRSSPSICTVVELEMAGVSFKPNEDANWAMEIKIEWLKFSWFPWFWVKPTLKLPILTIYDNTEVFLRNIIAYEQTSQNDRYFTSFVLAIDDLVNNGRDIAKLVESDVIINGFGSYEQAAEMINNIGKHVIEDKNYYSEQWQQLETYYNRYWPRHIARLRLTYFNSPWNIIALFAGIFLFTLTFLQTTFTINPRK